MLSTAAALAGLLAVGSNDPATSGLFPPCIFLSVTGLECPGCGSTRCIHQMLNGNFQEATDLNLLTVIAMPWLLWRFGRWLLGKEPKGSKVDYRLIAAVGVVVVAFGVFRNIDIPMFEFLAASD